MEEANAKKGGGGIKDEERFRKREMRQLSRRGNNRQSH